MSDTKHTRRCDNAVICWAIAQRILDKDPGNIHHERGSYFDSVKASAILADRQSKCPGCKQEALEERKEKDLARKQRESGNPGNRRR